MNLVVWNLYSFFKNGVERPEVVFYEGCIMIGDIVEIYLLDHVLRRFRYFRRYLVSLNNRVLQEEVISPDNIA